MNKLSIKYPRGDATFIKVKSPELTRLKNQIIELENNPIVKKLIELRNKLIDKNKETNQSICGYCSYQEPLNQIVLHNFISYSNGADEWRYDDYNIICSKCGFYNYVSKDQYNKYWNDFKDIEEHYK